MAAEEIASHGRTTDIAAGNRMLSVAALQDRGSTVRAGRAEMRRTMGTKVFGWGWSVSAV